MTTKVIPSTPLFERYRALRKSSQHEQLAYAEQLLADPSLLADEFAVSVELFRSYENVAQQFYPSRSPHKFGPQLKATKDLVLRLEDSHSITPVDARDRIRGSDHALVTDVVAEQLAFEYVYRELLLQRTQSPAHGTPARRIAAASVSTSCSRAARTVRLSSLSSRSQGTWTRSSR